MNATTLDVAADHLLVEELEVIANQTSTAERFAFEKGFERGRQSVFDDMNNECKTWVDAAQLAAEFFYSKAQELPNVGEFQQLRVGFNFTMGGPGVLAVLSSQKVEVLPVLRQLARNLEDAILERTGIDVFICSMATDAPDQDRISHEFPIYRMQVSDG